MTNSQEPFDEQFRDFNSEGMHSNAIGKLIASVTTCPVGLYDIGGNIIQTWKNYAESEARRVSKILDDLKAIGQENTELYRQGCLVLSKINTSAGAFRMLIQTMNQLTGLYSLHKQAEEDGLEVKVKHMNVEQSEAFFKDLQNKEKHD